MAEPIVLAVRNQANEAAGSITLPTGVFDGPVRKHLLFEAVRMQLANRRAGTHATKTRGSVRGGGKKPWRQKGTGRARAGSTRSPIWVGGATIFGPQPRNYSYRIPRTARKAALRSALALKAKQGKLLVLDRIQVEPAKTKVVASLLAQFEISNALILVSEANPNLQRATRNLPTAKVLLCAGANVRDILRYEYLIISVDAVDALKARVAS